MTETEGHAATHPPGACWWCHGPVVRQRTGRWRKYCRNSCRQRAYEQRKLNRAVDWVAFGERRQDRVRRGFDQLGATWSGRVRRGETSQDARELWSDVLDVRYQVRGCHRLPVVVRPHHRRPVHRDIGDNPRGRRGRRLT